MVEQIFEGGDKVKMHDDLRLRDLDIFNNGVTWTTEIARVLFSGFIVEEVVKSNRIIITTINNTRLIIPEEFLIKLGRKGHPYTHIFKDLKDL